jgi:copper chaperone CopZ
MRFPLAVLVFGLSFVLASPARADVRVEVKGTHLCCPACTAAVNKVLKEIPDVKGGVDQRRRVIHIIAPDDKAAQKALDALSAAGFYGQTGNKALELKDDSGVKPGKVESLSLTGVHNCCGACCRAIKQTLKKVSGVTGDTAEPKSGSFKVTGNFEAADVVKALNSAGFSVKVEK